MLLTTSCHALIGGHFLCSIGMYRGTYCIAGTAYWGCKAQCDRDPSVETPLPKGPLQATLISPVVTIHLGALRPVPELGLSGMT